MTAASSTSVADEQQKKAAEYEKAAAGWAKADLLDLWENIKNEKDIKGWESGKAFEYLIIRAFQLEGVETNWPYHVTYPQKFGVVEQIDGFVRIAGITYLIESKDYSDPLSIEAIAKLRFRLEGRPSATMGIVFARSNFSIATEVFAQFCSPLNVLLWSADDLEFAIQKGFMKQGVIAKYAFATQHGLPLLALKAPV
jgi:Restriction endonuclease